MPHPVPCVCTASVPSLNVPPHRPTQRNFTLVLQQHEMVLRPMLQVVDRPRCVSMKCSARALCVRVCACVYVCLLHLRGAQCEIARSCARRECQLATFCRHPSADGWLLLKRASHRACAPVCITRWLRLLRQGMLRVLRRQLRGQAEPVAQLIRRRRLRIRRPHCVGRERRSATGQGGVS